MGASPSLDLSATENTICCVIYTEKVLCVKKKKVNIDF